jgi:hypothetical protein
MLLSFRAKVKDVILTYCTLKIMNNMLYSYLMGASWTNAEVGALVDGESNVWMSGSTEVGL